MTTEEALVSAELHKLRHDIVVAVEYFSDLALQGITDIPMEVMSEVITAGAAIDAALATYLKTVHVRKEISHEVNLRRV